MLVLCSIVLVLVAPAWTSVSFPQLRYVAPGTNFELLCKTDLGVVGRIYGPSEKVPSLEVLQGEAGRMNPAAFTQDTSVKIHSYKSATRAKHGGLYTCVTFYSRELVEEAVCLVVVGDLCEAVQCPLLESCLPDYTAGTHVCKCDQQCGFTPDFLCSDTCEFYFHECSMEEAVCADKRERQVLARGFCPDFILPVVTVRQGVQEIEGEVGERITLDAGLLEAGVPPATIEWWVQDGGGWQEVAGGSSRWQVPRGWSGQVESRVIHCKDPATAQKNTYRVTLPDTPPEPALPVPNSVCSIYPAGVVAHFSGPPGLYDLACTHLLAGDVLGGPLQDTTYYIYGTFDQHEGGPALAGVTVFVEDVGFEVQRGWLVNLGGEKMEIREGVAGYVPGTHCSVLYLQLHLTVTCEDLFRVYYDGVIAAHVVMPGPAVQGQGAFGLCWESGGYSTNWQLQFTPECAVQPEVPRCGAPGPCEDYTNLCSTGPREVCQELTCEGRVLTPTQLCVLSMARQVSCVLRTEVAVPVLAGSQGCPVEECVWKRDVVRRGCPQLLPPFVCGETDQ